MQSNVRLEQMSLGELCPLREIEPFRATLQDFYSHRLFVAGDLVDATDRWKQTLLIKTRDLSPWDWRKLSKDERDKLR